MKITPTALTITQLFSNESEQFVIPAYQRRYSWQAKHIKELFDDINLLESGETHLLGSIVCLVSTFKVGINELELVDGQQRTTTIMLFLNAIEERLLALGKEEDAKKIGNYLYCKDYTEKRMNKLRLGDLDAKDFSYIMDNKNLEDVVNKRLIDAHELIMKLVNELSIEKLNMFKYKFINQANIIRLDVAESKDAFKLFETINNRGLTLSPSDIIKNFLLGNASLIDEATLESVKEDWTKLVKSLDGINMDDFFRQYTIGLTGRKVSHTLLIDAFKRYYAEHIKEGELLRDYTEYSDVNDVSAVKKQDLTEFVKDLHQSAEIYRKIVQAAFGDIKIDQHMSNLKKIRSVASYIFILNLMKRDIDRKEKLTILRMLEVFMLRRNIAEYRTAELEDIFARTTKLADEDIVANVKAEFEANLPSNEEFYDKLLKHDFRGQFENRAKYMLEQLEYRKTGDTGGKIIAGGENVHLEHIMPQTIGTKKSKNTEGGDWEIYLGLDNVALHSQFLAKIGNLTILEAPLNISASNNPFNEKKHGGIEINGRTKCTDYSKSEMKLNEELLKYDEFKFAEIEQRSKQLAKEALAIWKL